MYFVSIFPNLLLLCKLIFFIPNVMDLKFSFENTPPSDWHLFFSMVWISKSNRDSSFFIKRISLQSFICFDSDNNGMW